MMSIFTFINYNTFNRNIKSIVMEMVTVEIFSSYYANKMKGYLSSHSKLSLLHQSEYRRVS